MGLRTMTLYTALLVIGTLCHVVRAKPEDEKAAAEGTQKAEEFVRKQFPILGNPGVPPLAPITDEVFSRAFPHHKFFAVIFRQYPVARIPPKPLRSQNLFAVTKDGKVLHLHDAKALEEFFRNGLGPVADEQSAKDCVEAWLRLTEELKQDGFFKFSIPKDTLAAGKSKGGWNSSGKAVITQGGKGEIRAALTFTEAGKLAGIEETHDIKAGIRPICQATKLLDSDPVVRRMAEKDILVMGQAAKEYLDEQRVKASPQLQQAIDLLWQRIVKEGW